MEFMKGAPASQAGVPVGVCACPSAMTDSRKRLVDAGESYDSEPQLANLYDNKRHVVGEGTVPPCCNTVENCLLHIREW